MSWDDDIADEEWVDEDEEDSSDDLLVCPSCRREVHEDTQQCPHCGNWITPVYPHVSAKKWLFALVAVLLVAVLSGVMLL